MFSIDRSIPGSIPCPNPGGGYSRTSDALSRYKTASPRRLTFRGNAIKRVDLLLRMKRGGWSDARAKYRDISGAESD